MIYFDIGFLVIFLYLNNQVILSALNKVGLNDSAVSDYNPNGRNPQPQPRPLTNTATTDVMLVIIILIRGSIL